jgi:hypothetical protein
MTEPVATEQIREALDDYVEQANANDRVRRTLGDWRCRIHFDATDSDAAFTIVIASGQIASVDDGLDGDADLRIEATSQELTDIFWGEANPAERYNHGAVIVRGSQEDLLRLDAMAMLVFLAA